MNIRYRLTEKEFAQACRARSPFAAWSLPVLGGFLMLVASLQIAFKVSPLPASLALGVLGGIFVCLPSLNKRAFRRSPQYGKDVEVEIGDPGVTFNIGSVAAQCGWDAFREFKETSNLFLLYQTSACLNALPKRAFSAEEQDQFRALASAKVPPRIPRDRWTTIRTIVFVAVIVLAFVLLLQVLRNN